MADEAHTTSRFRDEISLYEIQSNPARRGFLRGLLALPLIGGGVKLIGSPSAVAEPISIDLLTNYETWLACEAVQIARELRPNMDCGSLTKFSTPAWDWHLAQRGHQLPSGRAALVLSTVGVDWRR